MNHSGPTPPGAGCHCPPTFLQRNFIFNFPWLIFEFCHISGSNQSKMFLSKSECQNWKIFPLAQTMVVPPYSLYIWPPSLSKTRLGPYISLHFSMIFMFFDLKMALFGIFFCIIWHFFMPVFSKMPVGSLMFGHLFHWYFTDQNVNLAKIIYWLIGLVNLVKNWLLMADLSNKSDKWPKKLVL